MNCEQALQAMSARLDGELPEDEARALDAHLRECAPCRALMAELTELDDGLKTLSVEPPETLAPGVMRAIRAETAKKQKKRTPHITTWLIAGAAALALALGAAGVIELPGFGEKGRASVSVGDAFKTEQAAGKYAAQLAEERGCAVLAVCGCKDAPEALSGREYETLDGGARLYAVPPSVMEAVMAEWQSVYPMQIYAPQEAQDDAERAYILILPE